VRVGSSGSGFFTSSSSMKLPFWAWHRLWSSGPGPNVNYQVVVSYFSFDTGHDLLSVRTSSRTGVFTVRPIEVPFRVHERY